MPNAGPGLRLTFDLREVAQLMVDSSLPVSREQQTNRGMTTSAVTPELLDAFRRLVDLLGQAARLPLGTSTLVR